MQKVNSDLADVETRLDAVETNIANAKLGDADRHASAEPTVLPSSSPSSRECAFLYLASTFSVIKIMSGFPWLFLFYFFIILLDILLSEASYVLESSTTAIPSSDNWEEIADKSGSTPHISSASSIPLSSSTFAPSEENSGFEENESGSASDEDLWTQSGFSRGLF
jgi:hypothetical protein